MDIPQFTQRDPWLNQYKEVIAHRCQHALDRERALCNGRRLSDFATGHLYFGLHKNRDGWVFREWAPNATEIYLVGDFSSWQADKKYALNKIDHGNWEIKLQQNDLKHEQYYQLLVRWKGGEGLRLPSYGNRMVQDKQTMLFAAQVCCPEKPYKWKHPGWKRPKEAPLIYEAHVGMATPEGRVGTYVEFRDNIIPYIKKSGYNTIQLMAVQEHPYYGSFGYHVSNLFAPSSRFGTPDELKSLIDKAHNEGLAIIMDLVHSHSVKNISEGLGLFDGSPYQYFHDNHRRLHVAWDSLCFNYSKPEVIHFLLSNCQYWLEEYHFDGFRFDGVTSMLYLDHGLNRDFTSYDFYFDGQQDEDAITYMMLANKLIHECNSNAITIAEEMSGMPGLGASIEDGGFGFDYRLSMGVPDYWIKIIKEKSDEQWSMNQLYSELTAHRIEEYAISYVESHDQALVGDKTIFFRLVEKEMYDKMNKTSQSVVIDRGIALHKMIRLVTICTAGSGYLTFMGNEFGHPEWIDFPREGNNWSYHYARRQWPLATDQNLKFHWLLDFDRAMIEFISHSGIFEEAFPRLLLADEKSKVLALARKEFVFVFNFNPSTSHTNYGIPAETGKYKIVLSTDDNAFGGQDRIDTSMFYYSTNKGDITTHKNNFVNLYLPARTAIVLKKIPTKTVY